MAAVAIEPKNEQHWRELRAVDVTSTESPALFNLSPYCTELELFTRKKDAVIVELESNERMLWGNRLQDAIAHGIAEDQGWEIRRMNEYVRDEELRMGSSFDFAIGDEGLLEIKNVDALAFRDGWLVSDEGVEAPLHIELQLQHQFAVTGRKFGYIGALVGGNRVVLLKREPQADVIDSLRSKVAAFWDRVNRGEMPPIDFARDAGFIAQLYSNAMAGKVFDARGNEEITGLALKYRELGDSAKQIESARDAIKAQLLMTIGDAEKAIADGFSITAGVVAGGHVEYECKAYRGFRVNWKKEKSA
jgi:predicted phage-related endonuclease